MSTAASPAADPLLAQAEALEERAALERVEYLDRVLAGRVEPGRWLVDVGCGNGYAVRQWQHRGLRCIGVDLSLYRLSRWVEIHRSPRPFVVADASALPFADDRFDVVVSSGMIEHVGVSETAHPYRVVAHPDQWAQRQTVIGELTRVTTCRGVTIVDFPNGLFPVDFWHGDRIGAFRVHRVPDSLLPSFSDVEQWARRSGAAAEVLPLSGRLRFRQVGRHWWGRAFAPVMRLFIAVLDLLVRARLGARLAAIVYPYLVVRIIGRRREVCR